MKNLRRIAINLTLAWLPALVAVTAPSVASAQFPSSRRGASGMGGPSSVPYQQRLSPYLDLLRADNSVLSPYHSFVQPRQQLRQNQNTQAARILTLERSFRQSPGASTQTERLQTGRGGMFNNYLHYYQFNSRLAR